MTLRAGDWVEVRSKVEILATLDKDGRLEGMPFMPQMLEFCGHRFEVVKRAHKTCDTVNRTRGRRLPNAVHLALRCDGEAYGGCQAACLIFWKEAWLKPVNDPVGSAVFHVRSGALDRRDVSVKEGGCTEEDVWNGTFAEGSGGAIRYFCQATELPKFTEPLPWWDLRQYFSDYKSRNVSAGRVLSGALYAGYYSFARRRWIGKPFRWIYDRFQALRGGVPYPRRVGTIPAGELTPLVTLNLKPGELVRVKGYQDILATLDVNNRNRGLYFDAEMVPFCGKVYRVRSRIEIFLDEKSGQMKKMKTPAVTLEGVFCQARYSDRRMHCPRSIFSWWREIWLERVAENT